MPRDDDNTPAIISKGEYQVSPETLEKYGPELLEKITAMDPYAHLATQMLPSNKPRWDGCPGKRDRIIGMSAALGAVYGNKPALGAGYFHKQTFHPGYVAACSVNGYRADYARPRSDTVGRAPMSAEERMRRINSPSFPTLAEAARRRHARNMRVLGRVLTVVSLIGLVALLVSVMTD